MLQVQTLQNQGSLGGVQTATPQPLAVTPLAKQPQITSVGTINNQQLISTPAPNTNGLGAMLASKINQARTEYPNSDEQIIQGIINDNKTTHSDLVQKIQDSVGTDRVHRNNNLIAAPVPTNGSNVSTEALDKAGVKWTYGDPFSGDPKQSTIKILGDPIEGARAILSNSRDIQTWYANSTGKDILNKYQIKNNIDFQNAPREIQDAVISGIKQHESGVHNKYTPTQILDQIIKDNPSSSALKTASGQDQPNQEGFLGTLAKPILKEGVAASKAGGTLLHLIKAAMSNNSEQIPGAQPGWTEQKKELALAQEQADPTKGYNIGKFGTIKAPDPRDMGDVLGTGAAAGGEVGATYIVAQLANNLTNKIASGILPEALQKYVPKGVIGKLLEAKLVEQGWKSGLLKKLFEAP